MYRRLAARLGLGALLLVPGLASSLGLGEIEIHSALNQPMDAEIEILDFDASELDEVSVELASQDIFQRVGVPRPFLLTRLRFTPAVSQGKPIIRVTSNDPIPEPFLTFLLDLRWSQGQLLREYTVLLDPPVFANQVSSSRVQKPAVSQTPAAPAPRQPESVTPPKRTLRTPEPSPARTRVASPTGSGSNNPTDSYRVQRGDTLWSIADRFSGSAGTDNNQMMLAIQDANPNAFSDNNINSLNTGVVLRIPQRNEAQQRTRREALAEVRRQWQVWQKGQVLAGSSDTAINVDSAAVEKESGSAVTNKSQTASDSKLSILGEQQNAGGAAGIDAANASAKELHQQISLLKESVESKDQANQELIDRIASLEEMLAKQESIINLQNNQLANLQNTAGDIEVPLEPVTASVEENVVAQEEAEQALTEQEETNTLVAEDVTQQIGTPRVEPLPDFSDPIPEEFLQAEAALNNQSTLQQEAVVVEQAASVEQQPTQVTPAGLVEQILAFVEQQRQNLIYAAAGLGVLLLGVLGLKAVRRRREAVSTGLVGADEMPAFEETTNDELEDTVIATPDSVDQALDELEEVDEPVSENIMGDDAGDTGNDEVLEEADVYISYGLYQQAEDLLKDAIEKNPEKIAYKVKLAEVYNGENRADDFVAHVESNATALRSDASSWAKVVAMGAALAPGNELFAGSESADVAVDNVMDASDVFTGNAENAEVADDESVEHTLEDVSGEADDNSLDFSFDEDELSSDVQSDQDLAADESDDSMSLDMPLEMTTPQALDTGLQEVLESDQGLDEEPVVADESDLAAELGIEEDAEQSFVSEEVPQESASDEGGDAMLEFDASALEEELIATGSSSGDDLEQDLMEISGDSSEASVDDDLSGNEIEFDVELNAGGSEEDLGDDQLIEPDPSTAETVMLDSALMNQDESALNEEVESDQSLETAMFDSSVFESLDTEADASGDETAMFDTAMFEKDDLDQATESEDDIDEDTVSLEQLQQNLTSELETLSFDPDSMEADSLEEEAGLPTLQTEEVAKDDFDAESLEQELASSETGQFEAEAFAQQETENMDISELDTELADFGDIMGDDDLDPPSLIEEVGTKLDLAKAFVDMGDEDAAKETLTEVMERGDNTQIEEAKQLLDKLS